jgi:hypothetical protein
MTKRGPQEFVRRRMDSQTDIVRSIDQENLFTCNYAVDTLFLS